MRANILPALAVLLAVGLVSTVWTTGSLDPESVENRVLSSLELTTLAQVPFGQADGNIEHGDPESGVRGSGDPESGDPESGDPAYGDQGIDVREGGDMEEEANEPDSRIN